MSGLSMLVTTLLVVQSVLGLGLFFQGLISTRLRKRQTLGALSAVQTILISYLEKSPQSGRRLTLLGVQFRVRALLEKACCPDLIKRAAMEVISPKPNEQASMDFAMTWVRELDRGTQRLAGFLTKTAPLMGLGGTLTGISESMHAFGGNSDSPQMIVHGFAVAIETTLFGIFVAMICLLTSRLLWQPLLDDASKQWLEVSQLLREIRQKAVPVSLHLAPTNGAARKASKPNDRVSAPPRSSQSKNRRGNHVNVAR